MKNYVKKKKIETEKKEEEGIDFNLGVEKLCKKEEDRDRKEGRGRNERIKLGF